METRLVVVCSFLALAACEMESDLMEDSAIESMEQGLYIPEPEQEPWQDHCYVAWQSCVVACDVVLHTDNWRSCVETCDRAYDRCTTPPDLPPLEPEPLVLGNHADPPR